MLFTSKYMVIGLKRGKIDFMFFLFVFLVRNRAGSRVLG